LGADQCGASRKGRALTRRTYRKRTYLVVLEAESARLFGDPPETSARRLAVSVALLVACLAYNAFMPDPNEFTRFNVGEEAWMEALNDLGTHENLPGFPLSQAQIDGPALRWLQENDAGYTVAQAIFRYKEDLDDGNPVDHCLHGIPDQKP